MTLGVNCQNLLVLVKTTCILSKEVDQVEIGGILLMVLLELDKGRILGEAAGHRSGLTLKHRLVTQLQQLTVALAGHVLLVNLKCRK